MVVTISGNPFAAALYGEGRQECILYKIASDTGGCAEPAEDVPMAWSGSDDGAVRLLA